jgi:hypothetical protein
MQMMGRLEPYELLGRAVSGVGAHALAAQVWQTDRMMSFDRYAQTAAFCAGQMREAGLRGVRVERYPADGKTRFGDIVMPKA